MSGHHDDIERLRELVLAQRHVTPADDAAREAANNAVRDALQAVAPDNPEAQIAALVDAQDWAVVRESELDRERSTVHIRKKAGPNLGNQFYSHAHRAQFRVGYRDPQADTLCGAPATQFDMSWAQTRHAKGLAHVECPACVALRSRPNDSKPGTTEGDSQ